jgi:hypothetical protein
MDRHAGESLCVKTILAPGVREGRFAPVPILYVPRMLGQRVRSQGIGQGSKPGKLDSVVLP